MMEVRVIEMEVDGGHGVMEMIVMEMMESWDDG